MNLGKFLKLSSLASLGPMIEFACRFVRAIILSHLLFPTEFGIAASLTVVIGMAETVTDISLDKFLQLRAFDAEEKVLAAVHRLSIERGALIAASLFLLAPWIAQFLGAPDQYWSFRAIALTPLLRGFSHFELKMAQRDFRYAPEAAANVSAQCGALIAIYPGIRWFGDHRAAIVMLITEAFVYVLCSHSMARHRYRVFHAGREIRRAALRFGLPLTLNGVLAVILSQFDRVFVGHWWGPSTLALYAVVLNLSVIPTSVIARILTTIIIPFQRRTGDERAAEFYVDQVWGFCLAAAGYAVFVGATLDFLVPLVFGQTYRVPANVHLLLTILVWFRISRFAPTLELLSKGRTRAMTFANMTLASWVVLAVIVIPFAPDLGTVVACILIGDLLSFALLIRLTRARATAKRLVFNLLISLGSACIASSAALFPVPEHIAARAIIIGVALLITGGQGLAGFRRLTSLRTVAAG